jgi:hypothetical protein
MRQSDCRWDERVEVESSRVKRPPVEAGSGLGRSNEGKGRRGIKGVVDDLGQSDADGYEVGAAGGSG